jgi:predicted membrane channel-forming protein YqfA (hemolysin III family)
MTIRTRKFFGTIFLLILVVVWSLLGMTIAQTPWLANNGWLQAAFYVIAGLGWVLPAMPIISWMGKADPGRRIPRLERLALRAPILRAEHHAG